MSDRAHLFSWEGKPIRSVETESSNTSGIAYGGGYLCMAANGKAVGRPARPTDATTGEVVKVDPRSGKTVARYPIPGGGGVHGLKYSPEGLRVIHKLDGKDGRLLERITLAKDDPDPHGMCLYKGHLYYCDAGIAPGGQSNGSPSAGYVCRID